MAGAQRYPYPNELYHYGTVGMRKGVRRYQNKDGTLTDEGRKRYEVSEEKALGLARAAYFDMNVDAIVDCGPFYVVAFGSKDRKYSNGVSLRGWCKISKSGGEIFEEGGRAIRYRKKPVEIPTTTDEVEHSGVKGQKWYHRQYQYYDGSLTPLGRIHYGIGQARVKKAQEQPEIADIGSFKKKPERVTKSLASVKADVAAMKDDCVTDAGGNCGYCAVAYDLRRRGYDVHAKSTGVDDGLSVSEILHCYGKDAKTLNDFDNLGDNVFTSSISDFYRLSLLFKSRRSNWVKETEEAFGEFPNNSSGFVSMDFVLGKSKVGHVANWERINGKTYIVDSTIGEVLSMNDYANAFANKSMMAFDFIARTDNWDLDEKEVQKYAG